MFRAVALVVAAQLAGCQLIFTLDDEEVTGRLDYVIATNTEGNVIEVHEEAATDAQLSIRFESGDEVDVTVETDGSFRFPKITGEYALISGLNANQAEVIETSNRLELVIQEAGRSSVEPVTAETLLQLPVANVAARILSTIGQWSTTVASDILVNWQNANPNGQRPLGLLDGSQHDVVYLLEYATPYRANQAAINAVGSDSAVMMVDGQPFDLTNLVVQPVTQNTCTTFGLALGGDAARLAQAAGPAFNPPTATVALKSVPAYETGFSGVTDLVAGDGIDFDSDVDVPAHDPFPNQQNLAFVQLLASHQLKYPNSVATNIFAGMSVQMPASRGDCPANRIAFDSQESAFATAISIGGVLLETDEQNVTLSRPGKSIAAWTADGRFDFFDVTLIEVIERAGALVLERRRGFRTRASSVVIDETLLTPTHRYMLQVNAVLGFPGASKGDYVTVAYPIIIGATTTLPFIAL